MKHQSGKSTALFALFAGIALAVGVTFQQIMFKGSEAAFPTLEKAIILPKPKPLGPVSFTDHEGKAFGIKELQGKWSVVFFGFTNCPDICPSTLQVLKQVKETVTTAGAWSPFQVLMVSVDPERDTTERLSKYVPYFDPAFIGLSASVDYTTQFAKNLGVLFFKGEPLEGGRYDVDHTAALVLINPQGQYAGVITAPHKKESISNDLIKLGRYQQSLTTSTSAEMVAPAVDNAPVKADQETPSSAQPSPLLEVSNSWIRPAPPGAESMAGYLSIQNTGSAKVSITGVRSDAFNMTMIHETTVHEGISQMRHLEALDILVDQTVTLRPLGAHLMLIGPKRPLPEGSKADITLTLSDGQNIRLEIPVRQNPNAE